MIREATINDADRIAEIDAVSSRYAYRNVLSDECLNELSVENRVPVHRRWITEKRFEIYVYEDPDTGAIRGMMGMGMCGDEDKQGAYELHYLYVDPGCLRMGTGTEMLRFFERKGREKGCPEYVVWVLEGNDIGKNFYEKNGYRPDGKEKVFMRWNRREIRYSRIPERQEDDDG